MSIKKCPFRKIKIYQYNKLLENQRHLVEEKEEYDRCYEENCMAYINHTFTKNGVNYTTIGCQKMKGANDE